MNCCPPAIRIWEQRLPDGKTRTIPESGTLKASSWEAYWPTADLEKRLFLDGWLKAREAEGRKTIQASDWAFCQDNTYSKLKTLLSETAHWRDLMGPLSKSNRLLTGSDGASRMHVILGTGLKTPTGIISIGVHDDAKAYYVYDPENTGDGTMEEKRVLDDLSVTAPNIVRLHNVPHGRLMIDPGFLSYFTKELSTQATVRPQP